MAEVVTLLKEIMALTHNVGELKGDVDKLWAKAENHTERIIKLEEREELLAEKMGTRAVEAVYRMNSEYFNRLSELEKKVELLPVDPKSRISD